jgi:3-oxoadipate enol-lactonase
VTALHHEITGPVDAPVLLFGGSLGTTLAMWDGQLALADRFRLVRFDHRGHGRSSAPPRPYEIADLGRDVLELIDTLRIERASYCGLSLGGMLGMWLAATAPARIDRLIVVCTAAHMPPASAWQERAAAVLAAGSTAPVAEAVLGRWLTPPFAAAHPEVRTGLLRMLLSAPADGYAACCGAIERMDLRPQLPRITAPTLVVSGSEDQATPVEMQQLIASAIPGARHEIVGPAAHIAAVEQPEPINQLIEEHIT